MLGHGISHGGSKGTRSTGQLDSTYKIFKQSQILGTLPWNMIADKDKKAESYSQGDAFSIQTIRPLKLQYKHEITRGPITIHILIRV